MYLSYAIDAHRLCADKNDNMYDQLLKLENNVTRQNKKIDCVTKHMYIYIAIKSYVLSGSRID